MDLTAREIDNAWRKLGYDVDETAADVKAKLVVNGKVVRRTMRSHGRGKISGQIPHFIRQQMSLNEEQFSRAIACPLKAPEYLEILRRKGIIVEPAGEGSG